MPTLIRPRRGRIVAGVCAAIANRYGWNSTLVRVLWIILSFFPGPMWVAYVLLWIFIPSEE